MVEAVLFDLGNTLVGYFDRSEFPAVLREAILGVRDTLRTRGLPSVPDEAIWPRVREEDREAEDYRVRPLMGRLERIFGLDAGVWPELDTELGRAFVRPIFARAQRYEDALPTLQGLRSKGIKTAILSNTPWGSPGNLWREELDRQGLREQVDVAVFCTDVGWRKPARPIFQFALEELKAEPGNCVFVGDDARWDLVGPQALGMKVILIDRRGTMAPAGMEPIRTLYELEKRL